MRYLPLALVLFAACDAAQPDAAVSEANVSLAGDWSIHMVPEDRVSTSIPPACSGSMTVTQDDGANLGGSWSCGAGVGQLSGFRVHESGGAWIGFGVDGDRWLTAWVQITSATALRGDQLQASR